LQSKFDLREDEMRTYEEELERIMPIAKRLIDFALLGKKVKIIGRK